MRPTPVAAAGRPSQHSPRRASLPIVSHDQLEATTPSKADRKDRNRRIAALVVGVLIVVFAVINTNDVRVHWLVTTTTTPLIVVIVVSFVLGLAGGYLLKGRRAKAADAKRR